MRFKLGNYNLFVIPTVNEYYTYRASLFSQEGREIHYGEYLSIEQLCYKTYLEIIIYQNCSDKGQLWIDVNQMYNTLTTLNNGETK